MWAPVSLSWAGVRVFTLAKVPTGMKQGVGISPWGVMKYPARAWVLGQVPSQTKVKAAKVSALDPVRAQPSLA